MTGAVSRDFLFHGRRRYPGARVRRAIAGGLCCLSLMGLIPSCRHISASDRVVIVQPLGKIPAGDVQAVLSGLRAVHPKIFLRAPLPLPASAYYAPRSRYRADRLIAWLRGWGSRDTVVIGLTNQDISTTKNAIKDWGVMGLGYQPGHACVASSFRLQPGRRQEQFYKVAIHELGHTQGLPHCPVPTCFMRDAAGGNPLNEEKGFCPDCRAFLLGKGWRL